MAGHLTEEGCGGRVLQGSTVSGTAPWRAGPSICATPVSLPPWVWVPEAAAAAEGLPASLGARVATQRSSLLSCGRRLLPPDSW